MLYTLNNLYLYYRTMLHTLNNVCLLQNHVIHFEQLVPLLQNHVTHSEQHVSVLQNHVTSVVVTIVTDYQKIVPEPAMRRNRLWLFIINPSLRIPEFLNLPEPFYFYIYKRDLTLNSAKMAERDGVGAVNAELFTCPSATRSFLVSVKRIRTAM